MALIPRLTNFFIEIKNRIEPPQFEIYEPHYATKRPVFSGLDEFNPTKMDSDDDIVDIGIEMVEDTQESDVEAELNCHKETTRKVLNFIA